MKITFVSNYINHHQIPLAEELYAALGEDYRFIQTEEMEEERVNMGWDSHTEYLPYLLKYYEEGQACKELIADSDIVVFGGTDDESYITERLKAHKPIIRYSERLYKEGQWKAISPRGLRKKYLDHTRYRKQPVYLLCAGAYVPSDFHIVRAYPGKMFKWGYFPPFAEYDIDELMKKKRANKVPRILWSGRFIDWKHPMDAVILAENLKKDGIAFEMVMVGGGAQEKLLKERIASKGLENLIRMTGFLSPDDVRKEMEQADIFLFTSDYREGWGAVLNEAMNSGCAVVANVAAGATPYLVEHKKTGLVYKNKDIEHMLSHVVYLVSHPDMCEKMGRNAYESIEKTWNAKAASKALINICDKLLHNEEIELPRSGPGSKAKVISPRSMYDSLVKENM